MRAQRISSLAVGHIGRARLIKTSKMPAYVANSKWSDAAKEPARKLVAACVRAVWAETRELRCMGILAGVL